MSRRCKYFDRGSCYFGDNCRYLHSDGGRPRWGGGQRSGRCKYFDRGHCYHGDNCRFRHVGGGHYIGWADSDEDAYYPSMSTREEEDLMNQFGEIGIGDDLPEQVQRLANRVYADLGADRKEYKYRSELAREIRELGYEDVREEMSLKNAKAFTGKNKYVDIYVNYKGYERDKDSAIIELKAVKKLKYEHEQQLRTYLDVEQQNNHPVQYGLLINFPTNSSGEEVDFLQVEF